MMNMSRSNEGLQAIGIIGIGFAFLYAFFRDDGHTDLQEIQPGQFLIKAAASRFLEMVTDANSAGIGLIVVSSYRSSDKQVELWNKAIARYKTEKEAKKWTAYPGTSNHEKGLAVDIKLSQSLLNDSTNVSKLEKTDIYTWLSKNAGRYEFKRSPTEPWHWVYYGK